MSYRMVTKDGVVIYRHAEPRAAATSTHLPDVSRFMSEPEPRDKKSEARKLVWHRVQDSGHLGRFCYDPEKRRLRIQYQDGSIYQYSNVSEHIYQGMLKADERGESVGAYIARYLKNDRHPFTKIQDAR